MSDCWFSKKSPNILTNHGLGAQVGERRRGLEYQPPRQIRILKPRIVEICKRFSGGAGRLGWVVGWGVLLQNADKSSPQQVQEIQPNLLQWSWWTRKQGDHHWHTSFLKQSYRFRLAIAASQCSGTSCDPCRHDVLTWRTTCDYSAE